MLEFVPVDALSFDVIIVIISSLAILFYILLTLLEWLQPGLRTFPPSDSKFTPTKGITLYDFPTSPCCRRVRLALYQRAVPYRTVLVNLSEMEQKSPKYLEIHPAGIIPALRHDDFTVLESNNITEYLDDAVEGKGKLYPRDPALRVKAKLWQAFEYEIGKHFRSLMYMRFMGPVDRCVKSRERYISDVVKLSSDPSVKAFAEQVYDGTLLTQEEATCHIVRLYRFLDYLERNLHGKKYLLGDEISIADFSVGPRICLYAWIQLKIPKDRYPFVCAWIRRIEGLSVFRQSLSVVDMQIQFIGKYLSGAARRLGDLLRGSRYPVIDYEMPYDRFIDRTPHAPAELPSSALQGEDVVLYGDAHQVETRVVLSVLLYYGVSYRYVPVDTALFQHKSADFQRICPVPTVPVLVRGREVLYDAAVICEYLSTVVATDPAVARSAASLIPMHYRPRAVMFNSLSVWRDSSKHLNLIEEILFAGPHVRSRFRTVSAYVSAVRAQSAEAPDATAAKQLYECGTVDMSQEVALAFNVVLEKVEYWKRSLCGFNRNTFFDMSATPTLADVFARSVLGRIEELLKIAPRMGVSVSDEWESLFTDMKHWMKALDEIVPDGAKCLGGHFLRIHRDDYHAEPVIKPEPVNARHTADNITAVAESWDPRLAGSAFPSRGRAARQAPPQQERTPTTPSVVRSKRDRVPSTTPPAAGSPRSSSNKVGRSEMAGLLSSYHSISPTTAASPAAAARGKSARSRQLAAASEEAGSPSTPAPAKKARASVGKRSARAWDAAEETTQETKAAASPRSARKRSLAARSEASPKRARVSASAEETSTPTVRRRLRQTLVVEASEETPKKMGRRAKASEETPKRSSRSPQVADTPTGEETPKRRGRQIKSSPARTPRDAHKRSSAAPQTPDGLLQDTPKRRGRPRKNP